MAIRPFLDFYNPEEEDMSTDRSVDLIPPAQPDIQAPIIPNDTPEEEVFSKPKLSDLLPTNKEPQAPMLAEASQQTSASETPLAKSERLLADYEKSLQEARKSDRMLKIGGALGDALATYINAQGQMNVKAPGVQVQQGAGLGKVADMFATAPEIASDIKERREAMMKQYAELAKGERAEKRLTSEESRAKRSEDLRRELTAAENEAMLKAAEIRKGEGSQFREEESKKRDDRFVKGKMLDLMDKVSKDFRYKDAYKESLSFDQVDRLMEAAKKGNQVAFNTVGTKMAKAMGEVGVLTESDVKRYVEGGSLTRKAGDSLLRMINGKPSEATIEDIKQITEVLKESHQSRLQPIFDDYARRAVQLGKTREQAYKEFGFPIPQDLKSQDAKIESFMKKNNISNKDEAIKILKENGKL
jgi:hypothetical protein